MEGALVRVLGVDPGTYNMGIGVVDSVGAELSPAHFSVLTPRRADSISQRLYYLYAQISRIIEEWRPSEVAIEEPFAAKNVRAAMAIGHAQAVAMVAAAGHKLPVSSYAPRQVKLAVTDFGGSSKEQVQEMVKLLLGLDAPPESLDASDALAVAICHISASRAEELVIGG
jgi:crossover junction endodeoxyribonuclease RuvC